MENMRYRALFEFCWPKEKLDNYAVKKVCQTEIADNVGFKQKKQFL
jgi:hypothetical protein